MNSVIEINQSRKERDKTLVSSMSKYLAEPFRIENKETIERVGLVTAYFDTFTHLLDDAKDQEGDGIALVHAGTSNLLEGIAESLKFIKNPVQVYDRLLRYWKDASEGERHLWRHHRKVFPYNDEDFVMLGKRGSVAKVPIPLFADISKNNNPISGLERGVESVGLAVQLFDDVFDWKEDLSARIYTHPIALAHQLSGSLDTGSIEEGMFYRGALKEVFDIGLQYLKCGARYLVIAGANKLASEVRIIEYGVQEAGKYLQHLKKNTHKEKDLTQGLRDIIHPFLADH